MHMREKLEQLMHYALSRKASDIHLTIQDHQLFIQLRIEEKIVPLIQDIWDPKLFEYIKFLSGFDLTNPFLPQSGQFTWDTKDKKVFCRFSVIPNTELQTGVMRSDKLRKDDHPACDRSFHRNTLATQGSVFGGSY